MNEGTSYNRLPHKDKPRVQVYHSIDVRIGIKFSIAAMIVRYAHSFVESDINTLHTVYICVRTYLHMSSICMVSVWTLETSLRRHRKVPVSIDVRIQFYCDVP